MAEVLEVESMRSFYVACPGYLAPGGISSYTRRVVEALAPRTCEVLDQGRERGVFAAPATGRCLGAPASQPAFAARLLADYLRRPPTVFLFSHIGLSRPLGLAPRRPHHRVCVLLHGIEAWVPLGRSRSMGLQHVDSLVFTTEFSRAMFLNFNAAALRSDVESVVIPLSAEAALEEAKPVPLVSGGRRRVVCVTRLTRAEPLKGISTLLGAATQLDPAQWEVVIVGDGEGRAGFEQEAARRGVMDRVRFTGWVSDAERTRELEMAEVFCLPSAQEGFGIAFLEAMVAGKPCVGAAAGAVPEVLPKDVGELFAYGDARGLAQALQRASDRVRSGEISPGSIRTFYDAHYSWRAFRERWEEYLARMSR